MQDIQSAISSIVKVAEQLDYIKRQIQSDQIYYVTSILESNPEPEQLILLGAYLATKQIMSATGQHESIRRLKCPVASTFKESAKLNLHFGQNP
ncbi:MAG: hypothetical protein JO235_10965 [Chroococcidiopsidaceae cyanobacterium CP_BM_RX_35]|nr:hypothetical protein [Chroococcidiopsidaceae cyanobacterium CP_BM_RX_35]